MQTYHVKVSAPGFQGVSALVTVQSYNEAGACAEAERIVRSQLTSFVESPSETQLRQADQRLWEVGERLDELSEKWHHTQWAIENFGEEARRLDGIRAEELVSERSQLWALIGELESTTSV